MARIGAQPRPEDEYGEAYYRGGVYADYLVDRAAIARNARRWLAEVEPQAPGRSLLDVGCAAGFFLEAARERGWSVRGLEVSAFAAGHARGLGIAVDVDSILSPPSGLPAFDVVTLWDVIEHLDRPDVALRRVRELLRPGGLLGLSTGDYGSLLRRVAGSRWRLFADPTHRFFFDEATLVRLLRGEGFEVRSLRRRGKWVGVAMALQQSPLPFAAPLQRWLGARRLAPMVYANLRDVMTVVAVR
jgi:2-polyprenyl-3-methyl-5-hydroxy-6-metoxy-1,4-benzoquinol methylase